MSTLTYTGVVDKSEWGDGPWVDEPDKVQWIDSDTDLDCLAVRNGSRMGHWCGYVGVPEEHPDHGKDYSNVDYVDVHGGLTFAAECTEGPEESSICHVPGDGRPDNVWWFGFDCAHLRDVSPGMEARDRALFAETGNPIWKEDGRSEYRTLAYVQDECARLAKQLQERSS